MQAAFLSMKKPKWAKGVICQEKNYDQMALKLKRMLLIFSAMTLRAWDQREVSLNF